MITTIIRHIVRISVGFLAMLAAFWLLITTIAILTAFGADVAVTTIGIIIILAMAWIVGAYVMRWWDE